MIADINKKLHAMRAEIYQIEDKLRNIQERNIEPFAPSLLGHMIEIKYLENETRKEIIDLCCDGLNRG